MPKVLLRDVVARIKDKVDKDSTNLEYYIGGEHFDYAEVCITKRGVIQGSTIGPAFHMHFMPGDVLLMSRNPHLRKAGVVDFEGICSDVSYVCRTKDESVLLQRYLPFIFQTDHFWEFAERNKKGSTNFFLNWSDFEKYEFDLPPIEDQRKLTELLWAAQDTKMAYQELLRQSDELVKSQFIELFGDPVNNDRQWPMIALNNVCTTIVDCPHSTPRYTSENTGFMCIRTSIVKKNQILWDEIEYIQEQEYMQRIKRKRPTKGDVIYTREGAILGIAAVIDRDYNVALGQRAMLLSPDTNICLPLFLSTAMNFDSFLTKALGSVSGSASPHINVGDIKAFPIILPPVELQAQFTCFVEQTDKSKFELKQSIANITALMKSLMQQDFSN